MPVRAFAAHTLQTCVLIRPACSVSLCWREGRASSLQSGMLPILGAVGEGPATEGPFELLLGCYARIRAFTSLAARLCSDEPASEPEVAGAAARVHRYHAVALPLHQADEDLPSRLGWNAPGCRPRTV